jgi:hypothetical protein
MVFVNEDIPMRYLVRARLKPGRRKALFDALHDRSLGAGSIAGNEYARDMQQARELEDGTIRWVEVCFCPTPLQEEKPYWEEYFELLRIQDAHDRRRCRDISGVEHWACGDCDCSRRLEEKMKNWGNPLFSEFRKG